MIAALGAFLAKSALMQSPIGALFRRVPARVWLGLAIAALVAFAVWRAVAWHSGRIDAFGAERYQAGRDSRDAEIADLRRRLDAGGGKLAQEIRSKTDENLRAVARDADGVRLFGAGKAVCPAAAFVPAAPGGHDAADRPADAALGEVHSGERPVLIALPFPATVDFAESHDAYRIEALAWREWHRRFTAWWAEVQAADQPQQEGARRG